MFVCGQVQGSSSSPSIHPCLTCLSSCVRKSTHTQTIIFISELFSFSPQSEGSLPPVLAPWKPPRTLLEHTKLFLFFEGAKCALPYHILMPLLAWFLLRAKNLLVAQVENRFHSPTDHILRNVLKRQ